MPIHSLNLSDSLNSLQAASSAGFIQSVADPSAGLLAAYKGSGHPVSPKWNVKIYRNKKGRISTVCMDEAVLQYLLSGNYAALSPSLKPALQVDDAGGGFPLGGVMVGVTDGTRVETAVVPPTCFQGTDGTSQAYLEAYAHLGMEVIARFGVTPETHRIEICNGFINSRLTQLLRDCGFEVQKVEIMGLLQDTLEDLFRDYIKDLIGTDLYYDPKKLEKPAIARLYARARKRSARHPNLAKTHWKPFQHLTP